MQPSDPTSGQPYDQSNDVGIQDIQPVEEMNYDGDQQPMPSQLPTPDPIQWQAAEYIQQEQTPLWYVGFFAVTIVLMGIAILLGAWTFVVLVPVMAVALILYTHRPPRVVSYTLSAKGLHINDQLHPLGEFKSFGVMQERGMHSLVLVPIKRFRPSLAVYFPAEVGEEAVDFLGSYLPMADVQPDAFDKIIHKLRI